MAGSTMPAVIWPSGRMMRGTYSLVSSIRLISRPRLPRINGPSKQFQGICPARKNTKYGTPPDGTFMTEPNTKLPTKSGTSVRMKIHETPEAGLGVERLDGLEREEPRGCAGTARPRGRARRSPPRVGAQ